jgi:hypothetical protein
MNVAIEAALLHCTVREHIDDDPDNICDLQ